MATTSTPRPEPRPKPRSPEQVTELLSEKKKSAGTVWHKLIPGVAITLQTTLETIINAAYGSMTCSNRDEFLWRSISFGLAGWFGLSAMKWGFHQKPEPIELHWLSNIVIVMSWLIAISDFPLMCWLDAPDFDGLSDNQARNVAVARLVLIAVIQAVSLLEATWEENYQIAVDEVALDLVISEITTRRATQRELERDKDHDDPHEHHIMNVEIAADNKAAMAVLRHFHDTDPESAFFGLSEYKVGSGGKLMLFASLPDDLVSGSFTATSWIRQAIDGADTEWSTWMRNIFPRWARRTWRRWRGLDIDGTASMATGILPRCSNVVAISREARRLIVTHKKSLRVKKRIRRPRAREPQREEEKIEGGGEADRNDPGDVLEPKGEDLVQTAPGGDEENPEETKTDVQYPKAADHAEYPELVQALQDDPNEDDVPPPPTLLDMPRDKESPDTDDSSTFIAVGSGTWQIVGTVMEEAPV